MSQKKKLFWIYYAEQQVLLHSNIAVWSDLDTLANICNDGLNKALILPTDHDAKLILW